MTERHHYKYVILDSSKENHNAVQAKFNVQIPHGITNASRVCVKSFTMPNSYHNVYGDLTKVRFVEFYRPTAGGNWVYEIFNFTLPEGYLETDDLITEIQTKFTNASGNEITRESDGATTVQHVGHTDTPTTVTVSHNTSSYLNTLVFDSGAQHKAIGLLVEDQNKHTIWESLGFDKRRILKESDIVGIRDLLNDLPSGAFPSFLNVDHVRGCSSTTASSAQDRTLTSPHAGTHENQPGLYIASKALGNDTMVGKSAEDSVMVAHHSDVLQYINKTVGKYAHITYHSEVPMWNVLTKNYINSFDIEIRDHKGHLYPRSAIADFVLVLMFETVEEMEYNKDDLVAYNAMAYRVGHPTSSGILG